MCVRVSDKGLEMSEGDLGPQIGPCIDGLGPGTGHAHGHSPGPWPRVQGLSRAQACPGNESRADAGAEADTVRMCRPMMPAHFHSGAVLAMS